MMPPHSTYPPSKPQTPTGRTSPGRARGDAGRRLRGGGGGARPQRAPRLCPPRAAHPRHPPGDERLERRAHVCGLHLQARQAQGQGPQRTYPTPPPCPCKRWLGCLALDAPPPPHQQLRVVWLDNTAVVELSASGTGPITLSLAGGDFVDLSGGGGDPLPLYRDLDRLRATLVEQLSSRVLPSAPPAQTQARGGGPFPPGGATPEVRDVPRP
jgi:hypothetical protein